MSDDPLFPSIEWYEKATISMRDELQVVLDENLKLLDREKKLVEALKYYANEFNWITHKGDHLCRLDLVIHDDKDSYGELNDDNESVLVCIGGKRAREVLKELGVDL